MKHISTFFYSFIFVGCGTYNKPPTFHGDNNIPAITVGDENVSVRSSAENAVAEVKKPILAKIEAKVEPPEVTPVEKSEDVVQTCENQENNTTRQRIFFPARSGCVFDNVVGNPGRISAFHSSDQFVSLPEDAIVCDLELKASNSNFRYDDSLVLTVENNIILAKDISMMQYLANSNGLYQWDFSRLAGVDRGFDADDAVPYFLGEDCETCALPLSDSSGILNVSFNKSHFSEIALQLINKKEFKVGLITTGDNDETDCGHTDLELEVNVRYVKSK